MRILVVSGFLGAGKTTFIKELARRTREDFSVMENEYGQVGIDGQLLAEKEMPESGEEDAGKLNIWELTEGCICCSMKSDFASSILTIANTIDPEYLIVEPTGVGMLSNVMNNIRLIQYERISLLSPITILDGNSFDRYCQEFPAIYRDQIASAGCVLVSKMEGADRQTLEQLEQSIRQINPDAEIFTTRFLVGKFAVVPGGPHSKAARQGGNAGSAKSRPNRSLVAQRQPTAAVFAGRGGRRVWGYLQGERISPGRLR